MEAIEFHEVYYLWKIDNKGTIHHKMLDDLFPYIGY